MPDFKLYPVMLGAYRRLTPEPVRRQLHRSGLIRKIRGPEKPVRLSMVVPCYNVAKYADMFFESLFNQNGSLENLEVICVDDGSTDDTAEKLAQWQARFPGTLKVIHQTNGGLSAARNTGLRAATGDWINFPDPDDFLHKNYLTVVRDVLKIRHKKPLLAICARLVFYLEDKDEFSDSHPLKYRFSKKVSHVLTDDMRGNIHLAANAAWLPREALIRHGLEFVGHGWGSFEDAHLINHLFMREPGRTVSFAARARYYYRKRSDASSLVDTAKGKKSFWLDQMENGYLDLLETGTKDGTPAPLHVQRTVLYEMMWRFHHLLRNPVALDGVLDAREKERFGDLMARIMDRIEIGTIENFELARCYEEHKVALLALFKDMRRRPARIYLQSFQMGTGLARFSWYCGGDDDYVPQALLNGRPLDLVPIGGRQTSYLDRPFFTERFVEVNLGPEDRLEFRVDDEPAIIKRAGQTIGQNVTFAELAYSVRLPPPTANALKGNPEAARLRDLILSPEMQRRYHGCWVLMDADTRADDNAEHLYHHLLRTGQQDHAYFVLNADSADWSRLQADGFQLLAYGSDDHIAAQFNASLLLSSHADHYILWPVERRLFQDLALYRYVFLQHGVTKDDLSRWINGKDIRLLVTAARKEYESIVDPHGGYVYTDREVALTGFARHDLLLEKARSAQHDAILIMPTWRRYLTDETGRTGNARGRVEGFAESSYTRHWLEVITSLRLKDQAEALGARIVFAPHPNMAMYLDELDLPDWVEIVDVRQGHNYQDLFARARMLITDYSSVAFDVAYIERPVLYYQFDADQFFKGEHVYMPGYFEYRRDGFGPVFTEVVEVVDGACRILVDGPEAKYEARARDFFAYRDGRCCARIVDQLRNLERTGRSGSSETDAQSEAAE